MMKNFINLEESHIIGAGYFRTVYVHPDNPNQCYKIINRKDVKENKVDINYHRHLKNRKIPPEHIAQFQGEANTSKGKAVIFSLIRDYDNKISKTLKYYLEQEDEKLDETIVQKLLALKQYLLKWKIVFVDVNSDNMVLCKTTSTDIKLIIIDALGSRNMIPIAHYINFAAVQMINRRWNRCIKHKYSKFKHRKALKPLFDDLKK